MLHSTTRLSHAIGGIETALGKSIRVAMALALLGVAMCCQAFAFSGPELRSVSVDPNFLFGGASATGTVTLSEAAPTGGTAVTLGCDNAAVTVPTSVTVPAGSTTATFPVSTIAVGKQTVATISATVGNRTRRTGLFLQTLMVKSVAISPSSVTGGTGASGTITLNAGAPTAGAVVQLSSSSASASVPATVTIASGQTTSTFAVTTTAVSSQTVATIKATFGDASESAGLLIEPSATFTVALATSSVAGGAMTSGTITLAAPAPTGGLEAKLASGNSVVQVQDSVRIRGGKTSATFEMMTSGVASSTPVTITASIGGVSETATLTVTPPTLVSVSLDKSTVASSESAAGEVLLSGPAPQGGIVVQLSSSSPSATVPTSVTVNEGRKRGEFSVTTAAVTSATTATITASYSGVTQTATLTISPLSLASVSVRPSSVDGGHSTTGIVALNGPAGSGGVVVTLSSSDPSATVPATVTIQAGRKQAIFQVATTGVTLQTSVTLTATVGTQSQTATLIVNPVSLEHLRLDPSRVEGGGTSTGTVRISGPAPAGGLVITLASNSASATVPATVTIPAGQNSVAFTIQTAAVTSKTVVQIGASLGSATLTENLTITSGH